MRKPKFPETLPADALAWARTRPPTPASISPRSPASAAGATGGARSGRRRSSPPSPSAARSAPRRAVGSTARSAYRLLDAPGADSFAAAWDAAIDQGYTRIQAEALERALKGAFVPVYRRGKLDRVEHRHCDKLAIALLNGQDRDPDSFRRTAVSRRDHRLDLAARDAAEKERDRRIAEANEDYEAEVQRLINKLYYRPAHPRALKSPKVTRNGALCSRLLRPYGRLGSDLARHNPRRRRRFVVGRAPSAAAIRRSA